MPAAHSAFASESNPVLPAHITYIGPRASVNLLRLYCRAPNAVGNVLQESVMFFNLCSLYALHYGQEGPTIDPISF